MTRTEHSPGTGSTCWSVVKTKTAVFPRPDLAWQRTSDPRIDWGMHSCWTVVRKIDVRVSFQKINATDAKSPWETSVHLISTLKAAMHVFLQRCSTPLLLPTLSTSFPITARHRRSGPGSLFSTSVPEPSDFVIHFLDDKVHETPLWTGYLFCLPAVAIQCRDSQDNSPRPHHT